MGKRILYSSSRVLMTKALEFDSKPFTTLIRQIYLLFKSLDAHYTAQDDKEPPSDSVEEDARKLEGCSEIERLLKEALNSKECPTVCDKVGDQYHSTTDFTHQQEDAVARPGMAFGAKRKREEEDAPPIFTEVKRPKFTPPPWKRIWTRFMG